MDRHFLSCTTGFGLSLAVAATAVVPQAQATLVYSGPINVAIPTDDIDGIYFDIDAGTTSRTLATGSDLNLFDFADGTSSGYVTYRAQTFRSANNSLNDAVADPAGPRALNLASGALVGPDSQRFSADCFLAYQIFSTGGAPVGNRKGNFAAPGTGLLGFRFTAATGTTDYGWMRVNVAAGTFNLTVLDYAYDNTGALVAAGAVPEPGSCALGCLAAGAVGLGAWRSRRRPTPADAAATLAS